MALEWRCVWNKHVEGSSMSNSSLLCLGWVGYLASRLMCCWAADGKLLQYVWRIDLVQKPFTFCFEFQFLRSVSHWSGTSNKQPFCNNQGPNVRLMWNECLCCRCCCLTGIMIEYMKCAGSVLFWRCFVTLQLYRTITISTFIRLRYWSITAIATRPFHFGWIVAHLKCLFKMISPVLMGILEVHLLLDDRRISVQTHYLPFRFC